MEVMKGVFQLLIFLIYLHRNNYVRFTHFQKIHLQIHLTLITHMHGQKMEGEEGNPQYLNLELMEEVMIHQQVRDHQRERVQMKILYPREKGFLKDMIGKPLMQEHLEMDHQEIPQEEVEEDTEEDHLEEDHHQEEEDPLEEVEDHQEEVEDPQEEEEIINLKVLDLSIYLLIILIRN